MISDFIPGSWVVGVHVPDESTWNLIKTGELNGFSLEGIGHKKPQTLEFYVPDLLKGEKVLLCLLTHIFLGQRTT